MSDYSLDGIVLAEDHGSVRVLILNRPEKRNAIDLELRVVLAERLESAMADDTVRAIVLTGSGGTFCSGGDISTMRRQSPEEARPRAEAAQRVIRAIWGGPTPVVAAVEGFAYGAGAALALACDRVVAARDASFSTSFTGVGLAGDMGISVSLPARAGLAAARQLLLLPRPVWGPEALSLGLADVLTETGGALDWALEDARRIAEGPPLALTAIRSMLGVCPAGDPRAALDLEVEHQIRLFDSADFAEGVSAFHGRRRPEFKGC
ncbi:enoyl-CoA hydratase/isomerase family protein [Streptomyces fuscichromogenes]|uniref:Enoyl-CoA hydratase n=1 Tax=Streptomyces fuscichromogenes TaxID=1324013 RepID=A0A918CTB5_9ACTN|nr:enoyl-CoA hydratase-related protein [Streptomyces fuscichromogenes]GGN19820.1 enoyl-CoA hydratase [Streptomyces fuscichromogenes]